MAIRDLDSSTQIHTITVAIVSAAILALGATISLSYLVTFSSITLSLAIVFGTLLASLVLSVLGLFIRSKISSDSLLNQRINILSTILGIVALPVGVVFAMLLANAAAGAAVLTFMAMIVAGTFLVGVFVGGVIAFYLHTRNLKVASLNVDTVEKADLGAKNSSEDSLSNASKLELSSQVNMEPNSVASSVDTLFPTEQVEEGEEGGEEEDDRDGVEFVILNEAEVTTIGAGSITFRVELEGSLKKSYLNVRVTEAEAAGEKLAQIILGHLVSAGFAAEGSSIHLSYTRGEITSQNQQQAVQFLKNSNNSLVVKIKAPEAQKAVAQDPAAIVSDENEDGNEYDSDGERVDEDDYDEEYENENGEGEEEVDASNQSDSAQKEEPKPVEAQKEQVQVVAPVADAAVAAEPVAPVVDAQPQAAAEVHQDPQPEQQQKQNEQHDDNSVAAPVAVIAPIVVAEPAPAVKTDKADNVVALFENEEETKAVEVSSTSNSERAAKRASNFSAVFGEDQEKWFEEPAVAASSAAKPAVVAKPADVHIPAALPDHAHDHTTFFAASPAVVGPLKAEKQYPAKSDKRTIEHEKNFAKGPSSPKEEKPKQPPAPIELQTIRRQ